MMVAVGNGSGRYTFTDLVSWLLVPDGIGWQWIAMLQGAGDGGDIGDGELVMVAMLDGSYLKKLK